MNLRFLVFSILSLCLLGCETVSDISESVSEYNSRYDNQPKFGFEFVPFGELVESHKQKSIYKCRLQSDFAYQKKYEQAGEKEVGNSMTCSSSIYGNNIDTKCRDYDYGAHYDTSRKRNELERNKGKIIQQFLKICMANEGYKMNIVCKENCKQKDMNCYSMIGLKTECPKVFVDQP